MPSSNPPTYVNSVFLYKLDKKAGTYTALSTLVAPPNTGFGSSVALSKTGRTLAVGADGYDIPSGNSAVGALYVFDGVLQVRVGGKQVDDSKSSADSSSTTPSSSHCTQK